MTLEQIIAKVRVVWPAARLVTARKSYLCDNSRCPHIIVSGEAYIDPGDSNPERAGGFGGYRYCVKCGGGE